MLSLIPAYSAFDLYMQQFRIYYMQQSYQCFFDALRLIPFGSAVWPWPPWNFILVW